MTQRAYRSLSACGQKICAGLVNDEEVRFYIYVFIFMFSYCFIMYMHCFMLFLDCFRLSYAVFMLKMMNLIGFPSGVLSGCDFRSIFARFLVCF